MHELFTSFLLVALAEIGDKTQLLSLLLAARFPRAFWPLCAGILAATLLNHAGAAYAGHFLSSFFEEAWLERGVGVLFILMGLWLLVPDCAPEEEPASRWGPFGTALVAFFLAEMGDKTQLATLTLGADAAAPLAVVLGTTLGMMAANIPVLLLGEELMRRLPLCTVQRAGSAVFILYGVYVLSGL